MTQTQRKCPGCGTPITVQAIDRQLDQLEPSRRRIIVESETGCAVLLLLTVMPAVGLVWLLV